MSDDFTVAAKPSGDFEVRPLIVQHREKFSPSKPIVEELEALLAEARTGKLQAVAVALVRHDDLTVDAETAHCMISAPGTKYALTHAIQTLVREWGRIVDRSIYGESRD
jgi:hypothetical protein